MNLPTENRKLAEEFWDPEQPENRTLLDKAVHQDFSLLSQQSRKQCISYVKSLQKRKWTEELGRYVQFCAAVGGSTARYTLLPQLSEWVEFAYGRDVEDYNKIKVLAGIYLFCAKMSEEQKDLLRAKFPKTQQNILQGTSDYLGAREDEDTTRIAKYLEDGSFNTVDEEEYELPKDAMIGLMHPVELSKDIPKAWKEQLSDYEVTQPFEQLDRPVYRVTEEEKKEKELSRFGGMLLSGLSLSDKLLGQGWYRGAIFDGGFSATITTTVQTVQSWNSPEHPWAMRAMK